MTPPPQETDIPEPGNGSSQSDPDILTLKKNKENPLLNVYAAEARWRPERDSHDLSFREFAAARKELSEATGERKTQDNLMTSMLRYLEILDLVQGTNKTIMTKLRQEECLQRHA
uniref:Uncharacterized protein n=1 Tax=Glossina austeni TaxID=7395 RepID=A0A1A9V2L5_GLOAU